MTNEFVASIVNSFSNIQIAFCRRSADAARREELVRHLDHIESAVVKIEVPPAFGDLFYGLRGHISAVRESLLADPAARRGDNAS